MINIQHINKKKELENVEWVDLCMSRHRGTFIPKFYEFSLYVFMLCAYIYLIVSHAVFLFPSLFFIHKEKIDNEINKRKTFHSRLLQTFDSI